MDRQDKKIYIVFFKTPTKMGKFIRKATKYKYNHVAISLDDKLKSFYSFSRYNKCSPFVGGFVNESQLRYNSEEVEIKVCEIPIQEETYNKIQEYIIEIQENSKEYIYNTLSAIVSTMTHRVIKIDKAYTCIEFVRMILNKFNIIDDEYSNEKFHNIKDLDIELEKYKTYEGKMQQIEDISDWGKDKYIETKTKKEICFNTVKHMGKLISRKAHKKQIKK